MLYAEASIKPLPLYHKSYNLISKDKEVRYLLQIGVRIFVKPSSLNKEVHRKF